MISPLCLASVMNAASSSLMENNTGPNTDLGCSAAGTAVMRIVAVASAG